MVIYPCTLEVSFTGGNSKQQIVNSFCIFFFFRRSKCTTYGFNLIICQGFSLALQEVGVVDTVI